MTPEGKVKLMVKKYLSKWEDMGAEIYYFTPATGGYGKSGVPDFIGCVNSKMFAIECKAGDNIPTALQNRELKLISDAGGIALVVRSAVDMELASHHFLP